MDEKQKKFQQIQKFFQADIKIKEILYNLAPDEQFQYDENYKIKFSDKMFDDLKDIKYYLNETLDNFNMKDYKIHLDELFRKYEIELAEAGTDFSKLKAFYKNNLSDMKSDIIKETGETCVGYTLREEETLNLINKTSTINEFLHVVHSKIINDVENYKQLPVVCEELSFYEYPCTLYGVDNSLGRDILKTVSSVKDVGWISMMNLNDDQMIMMIRDKGHALTIQINKNEDDTFNVKYFIPKLCNVTMINNLKGVSPVSYSSIHTSDSLLNNNAKYTIGSFDVEKEGLGIELLCFISNVPGDAEIVHYDEYNPWTKEKDEALAKHYDLHQILEEMDYPHLTKVAEANPILYKANGFEDYMKQRYFEDLNEAKETQEEAVKDGLVNKVRDFSKKIDSIKKAGMNFFRKTKEDIEIENIKDIDL